MFRRSVFIVTRLSFIAIGLLMLSMPAAAQNDEGVIDNCCYIDRQCTTQQDWVNGWYAYFNNLCVTSEQQNQQSTIQPNQSVTKNVPTQNGGLPPQPQNDDLLPMVQNPAEGFASTDTVSRSGFVAQLTQQEKCDLFGEFLPSCQN